MLEVAHIVFGQEVERAEHLVVFNVERASSLEVPSEGSHGHSFDNLLRASHRLGLGLRVVRRWQTWTPSRATAVVIVRRRMRVAWRRIVWSIPVDG